MKTVTINIYEFNELTEAAKQKAIESVREEYNKHNDFALWAIDNDDLFEPPHQELVDLFGEDYNFPLIKNTRESIYFDTDRNSFLDCARAMEVTDDTQFLKWLGIDTNISGLEYITFDIFTPNNRTNTTILFNEYSSDFDQLIFDASYKFDNHIKRVLKRIESDIDYRFSDESIIEDIEVNNYMFLEDGSKYE